MWRGPNNDGVSVETNGPTIWSAAANVRWRLPLGAEGGNSTPAVWGEQIFVTQTLEQRRSLNSVDRRTGKLRWSIFATSRGREPTQAMNPYCSSSPATDGERVYVWFGTSGVYCFDVAGKPVWERDLGMQKHQFGYGSSPLIVSNTLFLNFGPGAVEFVVALDKRSGRELWRIKSPTPAADDTYGTWSTPHWIEHEGRPQLLVALRDYFAGLDPKTGAEYWRCRGLGPQAKASPYAGAGMAFVSGDFRGGEIAVRLGGQGDVTDSHRVWREYPPRGRIATSIVVGQYIYGARANGIMDCLELETGDVVWEQRMPAGAANSAIFASPLRVGDRLYYVNQGGDVAIVEAKPAYRLVAFNSIREPCNASPVIAYGDLYLRTWRALWCIRPELPGEPSKPPVVLGTNRTNTEPPGARERTGDSRTNAVSVPDGKAAGVVGTQALGR